jgi:PIN domain nuclease of toxin-antitoxin system
MRTVLADPDSEFYVSVASIWEIAIKWRLGKLEVSGGLDTLPDILTSGGLEIIPINQRHVLAAVNPEPMTRDPFDRLLLAQCSVEELRLLTVDRVLLAHTLALRIGP